MAIFRKGFYMYYSVIGMLALMMLVIANHDVLLHKTEAFAPKERRYYRRFVLCILAYYVTDILWGLFDYFTLVKLLYLDTVVYFVAMASGILMWTRYVVHYLDDVNTFRILLERAGEVFFAVMIGLLCVNFFTPIMFWFDETGAYQTGVMRNVILVVQIVMILLTSIDTLRVTANAQDRERNRHFTIGLFGLIMVVFLSIQLFYPLLPLYSIGYMLGTCFLRTFVIEDKKREYIENLEASFHREQMQREELSAAWKLAYTDALTGVKSKLAFSERENEIDQAIANGTVGNIAVVVFDLNGLKQINDTKGHDTGDKYIISACRLICKIFQHSPVFRVGGDEFVAILQDEDYNDREKLLLEFNRRMEEHQKTNQVIVAAGMANYIPSRDHSFERVFKRADREMYRRKDALKHSEASPPAL